MIIKYRVFAFLICVTSLGGAAHAADWAPVNEAELKMTAEPKAPGAPAVILELRQDNDDDINKVSGYFRIKILTEEGRKYGNVEIRYDKNNDDSIDDIEARVIHPDGKIINFAGTVYDKLIIKSEDLQYQAKVLALPEVQVGSVLEYQFTKHFFPRAEVIAARWELSRELFIKHGKYSLRPNHIWQVQYSWPLGLPPGTADPVRKDARIYLETYDVPALVEEDHMPPRLELSYRVDFFYNVWRIKDHSSPARYWKEFGEFWYRFSNDFMDHSGAMEKLAAKIIQKEDSPEQKLRKIYEHVQLLRNLSYEKPKSRVEQKREDLKWNADVADVESRGYGTVYDLTCLFVALARAAGFQAELINASNRAETFFTPDDMNPRQLGSMVALVAVDNKPMYFQPGVPFTPFGTLPWDETGVSGLRLDKDGGSWIKTPMTKPYEAKIRRSAHLKLEDDGALAGAVVVNYTGLHAASLRFVARFEDSIARKERLVNALKQAIPVDSEVEIINEPDWTSTDTPLKVEYKVKIPGWVTLAGQRSFVPIGLLSGTDKHLFETETRLHPVYFHFPSIADNDIVIDLPPDVKVTSLPKSRDDNISIAQLSSGIEATGNGIHIQRQLAINSIYVPQKYYDALHEFYQGVRSFDDDQIVLARTK